MAIAITLREFLDTHHLPYETLAHRHSASSKQTLDAASQTGDKVAKSLLLKDEDQFLLAVLPANRRIHFGELHQQLGHHVGLATEAEVRQVFADCETGAVPPSGPLYDIETLVDDHLLAQPDVYFEAGDHENLVHMQQRDFRKLLGDASHGRFSHPE